VAWIFEFLFPVPIFRYLAKREVLEQLRITFRKNPGARISVIAHSFGTFVISQLMRKHHELEFDRIIFCGSVVPFNFKYENIDHRFNGPIINEVGTRDPWPAIAKSVGFGYGNAGTYGFRRTELVRDRWHNGAGHGYFLNPSFCKDYWVPWLAEGRFVPAAKEAESTRLWLRIISFLRIKWIVVFALVILAYTSGWLNVFIPTR
jgi:hypothetical protein